MKVANAMLVLPDCSAAFKGHLAKYETFFSRLVLTQHAIECAARGKPPDAIVPAITAERVARLMLEYLLPHNARFYADLAGGVAMAPARNVAGYILSAKLVKITARQVGRHVRDLRGDVRRTTEVMDFLTAINWVTPSESNRPGSWSLLWHVNPAVHERFKGRAERERTEREAVRQKIAQAHRVLGVQESEL
jgi:hypothetical protein